MAEVKIDELLVTAVQYLDPEVKVDELLVSAVQYVDPTLAVDTLYARGIAKLPASVVVSGTHVGGLRRKMSSTRFKLGYKEEVLAALADGLGISLPVANYDLTLGAGVSGQPEYVNLRLTAKKPSGYRRYSDVTYRRVKANDLLAAISLETLKPNELYPLNTTAQIVARMNTLFGTKFTDIDFVEEATPTGADRILTAKPESFYFQAGSTVNVGRLDMNERTTEIAGLAWGEVEWQAFASHATDYTQFGSAALAAITGSVLSSAHVTALIPVLNQYIPNHGYANSVYTTAGVRGLQGAPFQQLTLPAATNLPVDNSGYYNRALVIDLALAPVSLFRYLVLHYNV
jgi:hypothetical protein